MARKKSKKTKKIQQESEEIEVKVKTESVVEEPADEEIEVKVKDEKEVWELNCIESLAYRGIRDVFVGAFMVKDLLTLETKENE